MWYNKYVGLPYQDRGRTATGIDCWGLACLVYSEHFDIELPSLDDQYTSTQDLAVRGLVTSTKESWISTSDPKPGDICVFNILGEPTHVGIYVGDNKFLHARGGKDSVIESLNSVVWNRRLEGIYQYNPGKIQLTGAPHPLQLQNVVTDWASAGTSIYQLTQYIQEKYSVSSRLLERIVVLVDGVPISKEMWQTTKVLPGQTIAYRVVAGREVGRLVLTLAVMYIAYQFAGPFGGSIAASIAGGPPTAAAVAGWTAVVATGINMAGIALINAIAPITKPKEIAQGTNNLNLFTGSTNQINRFGNIPVVLGRVRMTAVHGATPYIESLQDTSIINMALVWGFGPLDVTDIQVGLTPIERFYTADLQGKSDQAVPITLYGYPYEATNSFDSIYGKDVTQQIVNVDLVNNPNDNPLEGGTVSQYGPWKEVTLTDQCTSITLAFNFPMGLRSIKPSNGDVQDAVAEIEVQYKAAGGSWANVAPFTTLQVTSGGTSSASGWQRVLQRPRGVDSGYYQAEVPDVTPGGWIPNITPIYQWHIITLESGGGINLYTGTPTYGMYQQPAPELIEYYKNTQLNQIATNTQNYTATYGTLPNFPTNHIELYRICIGSDTPNAVVSVVDSRSNYGTVTGLNLTYVEQSDRNLVITVGNGNIANSGIEYTTSTETEKFSTKQFTSSVFTIINPSTQSDWCDFLNEYGRWIQQSSLSNTYNATAIVAGRTYTIASPGTTNFTAIGANNSGVGTVFTATGAGTGTGTVYMNTCELIQNWTVTETGVYKVYFSADNLAKLYIDGELVMTLNSEYSYTTAFTNSVRVEAGTRSVKIIATNTDINTPAAVAAKFTLAKDGQANANNGTSTVLKFGVSGKFHRYKDAFNDTYNISNLPPANYSVRVRRNNRAWAGEEVPDSGGFYAYSRSVLFSVTGYSNNSPMTNPPGCYLAKTAIRLQSTGKVNGTVDGINALVQTRGYDVVYSSGGATKTWQDNLPINNPASLFRYVLTHPANMYAVAVGDIDLDQLVVWHQFCLKNGFTYNNVITNTQSVMDTLREICAAGLASPTMINGKWSVIIDKPRDYVTQYFTPHNSWGFESTKALPKIPDAFRVTINNEDKGYQPDEFFVYKAGVTSSTAKIYEQLQLPGVTNKDQAIYIAKWHFAQLKVRPETYKLNVDFEYLVCTRGDLVRVAHDIPQWGVGTGRITALSLTTIGFPDAESPGLINYTDFTTVTLSEEVYLDTAKAYCIRFRSNSSTFHNIGIRNLVQYVTGFTNTIVVQDSLTISGVEVGNLYMLGETSSGDDKDSQELIVLSIEPTSNTSAVLTLTDYSPQIYTDDFENLVYDPQITGSNNDVIVNSITQAPIIQGAVSDSAIAELTSPGVYTNILKLSLAHPQDLTQIAQKIEIQYVSDQEDMNTDTIGQNVVADKGAGGGVEIRGLVTGRGYKFRARYTNNVGTIRGPWSSPPFTTVITGKTTNNLFDPPALTVELDDYWLVITPGYSAISNDQNFKTFEYRVYKDSGSTTDDFWNLGTDLSNIKFVQSRSASRVDLRTFGQPRISQTGIQYRIACRSLDNSNNYGSVSSLSSFTLKTIFEEPLTGIDSGEE